MRRSRSLYRSFDRQTHQNRLRSARDRARSTEIALPTHSITTPHLVMIHTAHHTRIFARVNGVGQHHYLPPPPPSHPLNGTLRCGCLVTPTFPNLDHPTLAPKPRFGHNSAPLTPFDLPITFSETRDRDLPFSKSGRVFFAAPPAPLHRGIAFFFFSIPAI